MSSERNNGNGPGPAGSADADTGEPIAVLAELGQEPASGFLDRLRRRVDRRLLTSQCLSLTWYLPAALFLEFLKMIFVSLGPQRSPKGGAR